MTVTIRRPDGAEIVLTGPGAEVCVVLNTLVGRRDPEPEGESSLELTEVEKRFLAGVYANGYRWIVRDVDGDLFVFKEKPVRGSDMWGTANDEYSPAPSELFSFVCVEADEPTEIELLIRPFIEDVKQ